MSGFPQASVSSVFGRTGAVVATAGDYTATQVGAAPGTSVESYIGAAVPLVANTPTAITSVSLTAGTWLITARCIDTTANATPTDCEAWIGPTSASATGAYASSFTAAGTFVGGNTYGGNVVAKVVTLATPTVVYLNALQAVGAGSISAATPEGTPNASGITAVRIA